MRFLNVVRLPELFPEKRLTAWSVAQALISQVVQQSQIRIRFFHCVTSVKSERKAEMIESKIINVDQLLTGCATHAAAKGGSNV